MIENILCNGKVIHKCKVYIIHIETQGIHDAADHMNTGHTRYSGSHISTVTNQPHVSTSQLASRQHQPLQPNVFNHGDKGSCCDFHGTGNIRC